METIYKLICIKGSTPFVLKELGMKYPQIAITSSDQNHILFKSDIQDIEQFRNLYSPTHIINASGNTLNLSKREWRKSYIPAGIDPSLAYIMCDIAQLSPTDIVYDPFCGASTIPITALKYFDIKRVICSDISGTAIQKSLDNFKAANISDDRYMIFRSDIKKVQLNKKNVDKIITNLPFGIRVGNHEENIETYGYLEKLADKLLRKQGKVIALTQEKVLLRKVFSKDKWLVKSVTQVNEGGLLPEIFEIKRK